MNTVPINMNMPETCLVQMQTQMIHNYELWIKKNNMNQIQMDTEFKYPTLS